MLVVVALGGNALSSREGDGEAVEMRRALEPVAAALADLVRAGHRLLVTHGNGPQVGRLLLQQEAGWDTHQVAPMPLDVCVAETQGQIGHLVASALRSRLAKVLGGDAPPVAVLVTEVLVDPDDPAFDEPTKPVGPWLPERPAAPELHFGRQDDGRWRRLVASPEPLAVLDTPAVRTLLDGGCVVVAAGGGGIPVAGSHGRLHGVEAVVDKDRTAALLASECRADVLAILTDVPAVIRDWGTPNAHPVTQVSAAEAAALAGQLAAGSMGPKLAAAADFVRRGGPRAAIGALASAAEVIAGEAGTQVVGP